MCLSGGWALLAAPHVKMDALGSEGVDGHSGDTPISIEGDRGFTFPGRAVSLMPWLGPSVPSTQRTTLLGGEPPSPVCPRADLLELDSQPGRCLPSLRTDGDPNPKESGSSRPPPPAFAHASSVYAASRAFLQPGTLVQEVVCTPIPTPAAAPALQHRWALGQCWGTAPG